MAEDREPYYSEHYYDDKFEYRHVILPQSLVDKVPKTKLMTEQEWRDLGIRQSRGWVHYYLHKPEPHVLLFRRPLPPKENTNPNTR